MTRPSPIIAGILQAVVLVACALVAPLIIMQFSGHQITPTIPLLLAGTGLIVGETIAFGYPVRLLYEKKFAEAGKVVAAMIITLLVIVLAWTVFAAMTMQSGISTTA
ncbi:MAG TPA: hypothetical protein VHA78_05935 [Candidatus Peribacteraceae bacterium]|nr:hypothetical protein [Candidatus Peribacteraceae bacterium]